MEDNRFYVYSYTDPRTNLPFYIGKGTKNRNNLHWNNPFRVDNKLFKCRLLELKVLGLSPIIKFEFKFINQTVALDEERKLIEKYGRIDLDPNGILCNRYLDGENKAVWMTLETRKLMSEKAKERYKDPNKRPRMGSKHTESTKQYWSKIRTGCKLSESHKASISRTHVKSKGVIKTPNGEEFYCEDIRIFCETNGLSFRSMKAHKKNKGYLRLTMK